jgi:hypothetical protein
MLTEEQVRDSLTAAIELDTRFLTTEEMLRAIAKQVIVEPMKRASAELPPGTAAERLRNFAGRAWEIVNTPLFARLYRIVVAEVPEYPALAKFFAEEVSGPIRVQMEEIVTRGVSQGEFRPVLPSAAARALSGSLITQAFWCNHADVWGFAAGGVPSRVVPETLGLMLEGLNRSAPVSLPTDGGTK